MVVVLRKTEKRLMVNDAAAVVRLCHKLRFGRPTLSSPLGIEAICTVLRGRGQQNHKYSRTKLPRLQ